MKPHPILLAAFLLFAASAHAAEPTETVFFAFDDQNIAWQHNLKLTLVTPEKHPANPVVRCGPKGSPDYGHAILYGTVLHDGSKFRMWYLGMIQRELEGGQAPGWWRPWKIVGDRPANAGGERFEVSSLYRFGNFYYASGQLASPWCWLNDGRDAGRLQQADAHGSRRLESRQCARWPARHLARTTRRSERAQRIEDRPRPGAQQ